MQGVRQQGGGALAGARVPGLPMHGRPGPSCVASRPSRLTFRSYPGRLAGVLLALVLGHAHAAELRVADLADLSLEQLANIEVTSVSRRAERLSDAAASIYVITNDDIRRSGVTSLPEALRLAPNLQVARSSSSAYAISARGFNNSIGNKLLVLIDGRTVYTPLFSGVFWDSQDVMLEDIDRIEVISGPGGTLWGANAVNGVINIITRKAQETQGTLVAAGGGNLEAGGSVRQGGKLGADGHYRIYGKYFDRDNTQRANGTDVADAWHNGQVGFRADWGGGNRNFTLQGDAYSGKLETLPSTTRIDGANLLGRWSQRLAGGSDFRLQTYFDHIERDIPNTFKEVLNIFDIEFQHGIPIGASQRVLWGGGYRYARDRVQNSPGLAFLPADKNLDWANVFVQDEIRITETVELTAGLKLESNDYTGWETLPSVRLAWKPHTTQLLWTALSRAVRAPARLDRELFSPANPPFVLAGGPDFRSEIANVFEIGNRGQLSSAVSYSITAFYQDYDHLRSLEPAPGSVCVSVTPGNSCVLGNLMEGTSKGVEAWGAYQVMPAWRVSGGVLLLDMDVKSKPGSADSNTAAHGNDPDYQVVLRSAHSLTDKHELDILVRSVGELPNPNVPSYTAVDVRLGWRPIREMELSLTLQNLFDDSHPEFGVPVTRSVYERGVFLKLLWRL